MFNGLDRKKNRKRKREKWETGELKKIDINTREIW